jgi:hypothetical protein
MHTTSVRRKINYIDFYPVPFDAEASQSTAVKVRQWVKVLSKFVITYMLFERENGNYKYLLLNCCEF